ncbi:unnamed protein product [Dicrocoelium dendriticum]|nr:unnamed protein product [Dicrocoelium dendriticum]
MESTPEPELSAAMNEKPGEICQKKTSGDLPRSTAVAFVPWTLNRMLQEPNIRKLRARRDPTSDQSFSKLLRYSPFVQLGDFQHREVIGVVIENVNDTDLYIDFGGKFHCVCQQPANQFYPRGSLDPNDPSSCVNHTFHAALDTDRRFEEYVLKSTEVIPDGVKEHVRGYDFNCGDFKLRIFGAPLTRSMRCWTNVWKSRVL